jgi:hypothetical protein
MRITETISAKNLQDAIYSNEFKAFAAEPENKYTAKQLAKLYMQSKNNDTVSVMLNYDVGEVGRFRKQKDEEGNASIGLIHICKKVRKYLINGTHTYYDLVNATPSMLSILLTRIEYPHPVLENFIKDRAAFLKRNNLKKKDTLRLLHGGAFSPKDVTVEVINFLKEVQNGAFALLDFQPDGVYDPLYAIICKCQPYIINKIKENPNKAKVGVAVAYFTEEFEKRAILYLMDYVQGHFREEIGGYMNDGFLLNGDTRTIVDVRELNYAICEHFHLAEGKLTVGIEDTEFDLVQPITPNFIHSTEFIEGCALLEVWNWTFRQIIVLIRDCNQFAVRNTSGNVEYKKPQDLKLVFSKARILDLTDPEKTQQKKQKTQHNTDQAILIFLQDSIYKTFATADHYPNNVGVPNDVYNVWPAMRAENIGIENPEFANKPPTELFQRVMFYYDKLFQEPSHRDYALNWVAHMIQYPEKRNNVVTLVLYSPNQGTGKNSFEQIVKQIIGENLYSNTANAQQQIFGNFNYHEEGKLLVVFDECYIDRNHSGVYKDFVTKQTANINRKNEHMRRIQVYHRTLVTSNKESSIPVERGDRRTVMFEVTEFFLCTDENNPMRNFLAKMGEDISKCKLTIWQLYNFFKNRNVSEFHPVNDRPKTDVQDRVAVASVDVYAESLRNAVIHAYQTTRDPMVQISNDSLYKAYLDLRGNQAQPVNTFHKNIKKYLQTGSAQVKGLSVGRWRELGMQIRGLKFDRTHYNSIVQHLNSQTMRDTDEDLDEDN